MTNAISNPFVFIAIMSACLLVGVLIGRRLQAKKNEEEIEKLAFQAGRKEGLAEGDAILKEFKDGMAEDLGTQLGAMRNGMIETIKAYQQAIATCGERLSIPLEQRKAILPHVEPQDISEKASHTEVEPEEKPVEEAENQTILKVVGNE